MEGKLGREINIFHEASDGRHRNKNIQGSEIICKLERKMKRDINLLLLFNQFIELKKKKRLT